MIRGKKNILKTNKKPSEQYQSVMISLKINLKINLLIV